MKLRADRHVALALMVFVGSGCSSPPDNLSTKVACETVPNNLKKVLTYQANTEGWVTVSNNLAPNRHYSMWAKNPYGTWRICQLAQSTEYCPISIDNGGDPPGINKGDMLAPNLKPGMLVARVGSAEPYVLGTKQVYADAPSKGGALQVAMNDVPTGFYDNGGQIDIYLCMD